MARTATAITKANDLASCAYREAVGATASAAPAHTPSRGPPNSRPSHTIPATATATAVAEGSRMVNGLTVATCPTMCIST